MGKAPAQSVIENGDFAIGTFRSQKQVATFNNLRKGKAFALTLDITKLNEVDKTFHLVKEKNISKQHFDKTSS